MRLEFMYSYDIKMQANSRITLSFNNKRKRIDIICSPGQIVHSLSWYTFQHIIGYNKNIL